MRKTILVTGMLVCMAAGVGAAEKSKALALIENARVAINAAAAKAGDNKGALADLEQARGSLRKAEEALEKGRKLFGFGDVKPEAEQDVTHYTGLAELAVTLAGSRLEKGRAEAELDALNKQVASVKARVKLFEDRKAEMEKLRAEVAKYQDVGKELEAVKAERAALVRKGEELKAENSRLTEQLEKVQAERTSLAAQLVEARKGAPAEVPAAPAAVRAKPADAVAKPEGADGAGAVTVPLPEKK